MGRIIDVFGVPIELTESQEKVLECYFAECRFMELVGGSVMVSDFSVFRGCVFWFRREDGRCLFWLDDRNLWVSEELVCKVMKDEWGMEKLEFDLFIGNLFFKYFYVSGLRGVIRSRADYPTKVEKHFRDRVMMK